MVVVAACGSSGAGEVSAVAGPASVSGSVTQVEDEFYIPEFTLTLSDGSVFDSERVDGPLYLVFWAEW